MLPMVSDMFYSHGARILASVTVEVLIFQFTHRNYRRNLAVGFQHHHGNLDHDHFVVMHS